jgi:hypothetical protein
MQAHDAGLLIEASLARALLQPLAFKEPPVAIDSRLPTENRHGPPGPAFAEGAIAIEASALR